MFIYFILFPIIILLSIIYDQYKTKGYSRIFIYVIFFILLLFIGFRNNVGVDFYSYKMIFYNYRNLTWIEPSYKLIVYVVQELKFNFYFVNILTTLITLYFLFNAIFYHNISIAFAVTIFLFSHFGYGFIVNGVRQGIAASIFLFSLKYVVKQKFNKYIIFIFLATSFHYSSILLFPIYFLPKINIKNYFLWLILLALFFIKQFSLFSLFYNKLLYYSKYSKYLNTFLINQVPVSSGYFYYLNLFFILFLLLLISYKENTSIRYNFFKNILLLLLICKYLFFEIAILYRFIIYFEFTLILIIPYFFNNNKIKQKTWLYFIYTIMLFLQFLISLFKPYYKLEYHSILF